MTAVIYARYSSDNQREESIEGQIRECTAYAEKNGITIVKHYIDRAISAKTDNRPEFQQMIKDSDKKLFDIVLVWKLDRFARNRYDSARYKTQLKKNGVKLMSATEIISEGPEGIILESVLEGYAEYYSADLSEKVIRGMTENALKGKFTGGAIPFGYIINADHRFEIDPLTAPFVAETFQRYNDGQTMREIRDWLNEKGVKNQRGGLMTFNTIQHMLNNRRYIGELKYRDVLIPDAIPSIVSAELFNDVPEYVWDAFPVHPFDYLLKPYKEEKFDHLAGELRRVLGRQQPELEVRIARQIVRLPLTKIYYATAQNHYVRVVTDDGECRATANFAQVQEQLQTQPEFLVCNRGVIINMSKVLRFEGDCIEMLDGTHLPVRQKDKNSLLAQFTQYQFRGMQREF